MHGREKALLEEASYTPASLKATLYAELDLCIEVQKSRSFLLYAELDLCIEKTSKAMLLHLQRQRNNTIINNAFETNRMYAMLTLKHCLRTLVAKRTC